MSASSNMQVLPVDQYLARLNRKRTAAGVLIRDAAGRVLLTEPTYKDNWEILGGAGEVNEGPWTTARRELAEEIGMHRPLGRLLVVDHVLPHDNRTEGIVFVFDGGVLDESDLVDFVLPVDEIRSVGFFTLDEARALVKPLLANRIAVAMDVIETNGETAWCEHGRRIQVTDDGLWHG